MEHIKTIVERVLREARDKRAEALGLDTLKIPDSRDADVAEHVTPQGRLRGRVRDEDLRIIVAGEEKPYPAIKKLRAWRTPVLLLSGPRGNGKTFAAAWAAYHSPVPWVWLDGTRLAEVVMPSFHERLDGAHAIALDTPLMIIDEFATGAPSDRDTAAVQRIIWYRTRVAGLRTILTTTATAAMISDRYGPALSDRLARDATVAALDGKSYRRGS